MTQPVSQSALGKVLTRLATIQPHETRAVVAAFCLFFCVMGGYFAVRPVRETVGTLLGRVLETPGHTLDHVSYVFDDEKAVFAADTLFSIGCGRVIEGT